jgi:hypothetical protein
MSSHPERADNAEARRREIDTLLAEIAADPYVRQQLAESLADFKQGIPAVPFTEIQAEVRARHGGTGV